MIRGTARGRAAAALAVVLAMAGLLAGAPRSPAADVVDLEVTAFGAPQYDLLGNVKEVIWTVTVRNSTASGLPIATATNIVVRDTLSTVGNIANPRANDAVSTGTYDDGTGTWRIPSLAAGATATLTYRTVLAANLAAPSATISVQITAQTQADVDSQPAENAIIGDQDDEAVYRTGQGTNRVIGDLVWNDLNFDGRLATGEPGVPGVSVIVTNASTGATLFSGQTAANGSWTFAGVPNGTSIRVRFVLPAGATFTTAKVGVDAGDSDADPATGTTATRTINGDDPNIDAGVRLPADVSVAKAATPTSGTAPVTASYTVTVTSSGPNPAAGLAVTDSLPAGGTVVAAPGVSQGTVVAGTSTLVWTIGQLASGATATMTYQLRFGAAGSQMNRAQITAMTTPDPDSQVNAATVDCASQAGQDDCATATVAVAPPPPGTVAGVVWRDTNGDGQRQTTEPLQSGVTVRARTGDDAVVSATTTSTSGAFSFSLTAGTYVVEVVAPAGARFTTPDTGADASDSDVAAATGRVTVTVASSTTTTVDAGIVRADAPVGGTVLVPQGVPVTFNVLDDDGVPGRAAGGELPAGWSWARLEGGAWGSLTCTAAGACTYVPVATYAGADSFRYALTNPTFGAATVTVAITVLHVNDAPVARDDRAVTAPGTATTVAVTANDEDPNDPAVAGDPNRPGDPPRVTATGAVTQAGAGTAACAATTCTFTPAPGFTGTARFTYTLTDTGASDARVASAGVPGGLAAIAPRTSTATVTVWVDPARRARTGFVGVTGTVSAAATAPWSPTTTASALAACASARPRVVLTWDGASRATSYLVERQAVTGAGSDRWAVVATTSSTTWTDTLVGEAVAVRHRVTPLRSRWRGQPSPVTTATPPPPTSPAGC